MIYLGLDKTILLHGNRLQSHRQVRAEFGTPFSQLPELTFRILPTSPASFNHASTATSVKGPHPARRLAGIQDVINNGRDDHHWPEITEPDKGKPVPKLVLGRFHAIDLLDDIFQDDIAGTLCSFGKSMQRQQLEHLHVQGAAGPEHTEMESEQLVPVVAGRASVHGAGHPCPVGEYIILTHGVVTCEEEVSQLVQVLFAYRIVEHELDAFWVLIRLYQ